MNRIFRVAARVAGLTQPLSDRYDYGDRPFPEETSGEDEDEDEDGRTGRSIITHPPTTHPRGVSFP